MKFLKRLIKIVKEKISLFILPACSPELNPDELLNQEAETNAVRRKRAANKTELKGI